MSEHQPQQPAAEAPATLKPQPTGDERRPFRPRRERPGTRADKPAEMKPLEDLSLRGPNVRELNAQIEDDLNAAMAGFDEGVFLAEPSKPKATAASGPKKGKIIAIHGDDVFIDVPGGRSQGVMSLEQFDGKPPTVGAEIEIEIEGYDGANGLLKLSKRGAVQSVDWSSVAVGMVVEARVTAVNKGGLSVEVNGIRGFMPLSQLDLYRVEQPEQFVNQRLRCVVSEVKPDERNLVVSRRTLLEREREEQRAKFWSEIEEGQTRTGIVRSIREFGVFVDIGGADGLVPISEMSWARVNHPKDLVTEGQSVQVKVMRLDRDNRKISLSLRALAASPWDTLETRIMPGSVVQGKVTRIAEFGAFVEIETGVEGLVHISEIASTRVRRVRDHVTEGQMVQVKVQQVDKESRRISLSMRDAAAKVEEVEAPSEEPLPPQEALVKSKPRNIPLRGGVGRDIRLPEL
jgi:small subunit ribosomal protein S1